MLACILLASCSHGAGASGGGDSEEAPAAPVQVAVARKAAIEHLVTVEGVLYPLQQANIVPKISAPVQRFLAQRGDHVSKGQLLAILENRDLAAAAQESKDLYQQAEANYENTKSATMPTDLAKAQADVQAAREGLAAAQKVYESRSKLYHEGALAEKLVEDARVAMVQAQSQYSTAQQTLKSLESVGRREQLESAESQMRAAKAHYESAEAQASYAEVRSPITGMVADRPINVGEMASAGSALFSIVDVSTVVARASVPVKEAAALQVGAPATISGAGGDIAGKVSVVSPAVDPNTTTVQIWVQARNAGEGLKPGESVKISIRAGEIPDALIVPPAAILPAEDGGEKVMVARTDNLAHNSKVKTGLRTADAVQILSGVKPGDRVITEGGLGLDDKSNIKIVTGSKEGEQ
ncbi:MAG: efflux RND transporter periplasmic adaptor subunit [Acidobacteriaceae bacterium]|nr:efflux RND transporter periplasmic adaptor subunit [Acidobacteriaceae bacterium]